MSLIGFQRIGDSDDPDASWVIPSTLSADQLLQALDLIKKFEFSPPVFDDGREAGDFIRRKSAGTAARRSEVFDDEDNGIDDDDEELFPMGGPTAMTKSDALKELKKTRRRRRKEATEEEEDNGPTDEQVKARADVRRARELEKRRKIKSELFVHDSDDESDEERDRAFFEAEEKLRQRSNITIMKELLGIGKSNHKPAESTKKRRSSAISAESDDDDILMTGTRKRQSSPMLVDSDDDAVAASGRSSSPARDNVFAESDDEATDTPMSSPHMRSPQTKRRKVLSDGGPDSPNYLAVEKGAVGDAATSEDEEEDALPIARPTRQRIRAGFIVDSSDEE